jgi:quinol monooxygenase YgiN
MIQATLRMDFPPVKFPEAVQILKSIIDRTMSESGCISCSMYEDPQKNHIFYEEKWRNDEDLQRHLRSDEYQKVLLVMEMAITHPDIRFDTIVSTSGVEVIEKARIKKEG